MGLHVNIDGSKKIISSVYANINGASRKLSSLYANVNGSSKDVLAVRHAWKRYAATSWENTLGSWTPYDEDTTCSFDSSATHSVHHGYVTPWNYPYMSYSSFSFNTSTGKYTGIGGESFDVTINDEKETFEISGTNPYNRWIFPWGSSGNTNQICQVNFYNLQIFCKKYNSAGTLMSVETYNNGFGVLTYRYAKPTAYSTSYDIVTSTDRYRYPDDGDGYSYSPTGSYEYSGYKYEYIGQL